MKILFSFLALNLFFNSPTFAQQTDDTTEIKNTIAEIKTLLNDPRLNIEQRDDYQCQVLSFEAQLNAPKNSSTPFYQQCFKAGAGVLVVNNAGPQAVDIPGDVVGGLILVFGLACYADYCISQHSANIVSHDLQPIDGRSEGTGTTLKEKAAKALQELKNILKNIGKGKGKPASTMSTGV